MKKLILSVLVMSGLAAAAYAADCCFEGASCCNPPSPCCAGVQK